MEQNTKKYDVVALGELLIDFAMSGSSEQGSAYNTCICTYISGWRQRFFVLQKSEGANMMLKADEVDYDMIRESKIYETIKCYCSQITSNIKFTFFHKKAQKELQFL